MNIIAGNGWKTFPASPSVKLLHQHLANTFFCHQTKDNIFLSSYLVLRIYIMSFMSVQCVRHFTQFNLGLRNFQYLCNEIFPARQELLQSHSHFQNCFFNCEISSSTISNEICPFVCLCVCLSVSLLKFFFQQPIKAQFETN